MTDLTPNQIADFKKQIVAAINADPWIGEEELEDLVNDLLGKSEDGPFEIASPEEMKLVDFAYDIQAAKS